MKKVIVISTVERARPPNSADCAPRPNKGIIKAHTSSTTLGSIINPIRNSGSFPKKLSVVFLNI